MKVLLINGSPNEKGNTYKALALVEEELNKEGVETEVLHIGNKPIRGCTACGTCRKTGSNRCVFNDDPVNTAIEKAEAADGLIVGSPVYFASANSSVTALLDRMFFAARSRFTHKPAASVVTMRRAGATFSVDQLNRYFTINQMPVVSSQYWNMMFAPGKDGTADAEGEQIMRTLGKNMAWLLKCIDAGKTAGILPPGK